MFFFLYAFLLNQAPSTRGRIRQLHRTLPLMAINKHNEGMDLCKEPLLAIVSIPLRSALLDRTPYIDEEPPGGAFRGGEPALDLFPFEGWARLIARRARQSLRTFARYQLPAGFYPWLPFAAQTLDCGTSLRLDLS